jgi:pyruvate formate lyase activating enzyme
LLIPGQNDSSAEIDAMTKWVSAELGPDVPMHFTAFHPEFKMLDTPPTPPATLTRARAIALDNGIRFAYTGNVHDRDGGSTRCPNCQALVIERDWYTLGQYALSDRGACTACGVIIPGIFDGPAGTWGARRQPVHLAQAGPQRRAGG